MAAIQYWPGNRPARRYSPWSSVMTAFTDSLFAFPGTFFSATTRTADMGSPSSSVMRPVMTAVGSTWNIRSSSDCPAGTVTARALAAAALLLLVVAGASAQGTLRPDNEELGKKLFFDTNLDRNSVA